MKSMKEPFEMTFDDAGLGRAVDHVMHQSWESASELKYGGERVDT
jgi:hypothetical protein